MSKVVVLKLNGNSQQGFQVRLEISEERDRPFLAVQALLPPAPFIFAHYHDWQTHYRQLNSSSRIKPKLGQVTNVSVIDFNHTCNQGAQKFRDALNLWLKTEPFRPIREKLLEQLNPLDHIQVLIQTSDYALRQVPWHIWEFFDRYPLAEVAISAAEYEIKTPPAIATYREKVRILAILGDRTGIDIERDRVILEQLPDAATTFLVEPPREQLTEQLWDQAWDILFFAGHSSSQQDGQSGHIAINPTEQFSLDELEKALKTAVSRGLSIAIFNSCEGLGLARQIEALHIPYVIVMREPVPDRVAQAFLNHFLSAFAAGKSLHLAVREAREKLQGLEHLFPCATWLPVICQNPAALTTTWQQLGRRTRPNIKPYRGLFAFQPEDAPFFYGREIFTSLLVETVRKQAFVAVVGASGSGKSSVVFAGLIPHLLTEQWQVVTLRPSDRPLHALANALISPIEDPLHRIDRLREVRKLADDLRSAKNVLRDLVDELIWQNAATPLLLVIDQFEELYTLCRDAEEQQIFLERLLEVVDHSLNFSLVITLRADFLGQALSSHQFAAALQFADLKLGPMSPAELQTAIEQPAIQLGVTFEDGLTERMLNAVMGKLGKLPLLEFALTQLWESQENNQLTHAAYDAIGGVEGALARYAEAVYDQLNEEQKERSRRILIQLVHPGDGAEDTRRLATADEVGTHNWDLITHLANARLLVTNTHDITDEQTVELVHEALIQHWERLRLWVELDRAFRIWQERLRITMRQWEANKRDAGILLRGALLAEAEGWLQSRSPDLNAAEREFIEKSRRSRSRQRQKLVFGLSVGLVGALVLAGAAAFQWQRAEQQRQTALARQLAAESAWMRDQRNTSRPLSILLAIESLRQSPSLEAEQSLREGLALLPRLTSRHDFNLFNFSQEVGANGTRLSRAVEGVGPMGFSLSPDGQYVAIAAYLNSTAVTQIWDTRSGHKVGMMNHSSTDVTITLPIALSQNGQYLAAAETVKSQDASRFESIIRVQQTSTRRDVLRLRYDKQIQTIAISPDGQYLVVLSDKNLAAPLPVETSNTVTIFEIKSGSTIGQFEAHHSVGKPVFSPDSRYLAMTGEKLWVWDVINRRSTELIQDTGLIFDVTFSQNGKLLVTTGSDQTARIWNIETRREVSRVYHENIQKVALSPDAHYLATTSQDDVIRVWDLSRNLEVSSPSTDRPIDGLSFSQDGKTLIAASQYGVTYVWERAATEITVALQSQEPRSILAPLTLSSNNRYFTITEQQTNIIPTLRDAKPIQPIWETANGQPVALPATQGSLVATTLATEDPRVAIADSNNKIEVWQVGNLQKISQISLGTQPIPSSFCIPDQTIPNPLAINAFFLQCQQSDLSQYEKIYSASFTPNGQSLVIVTGSHFSQSRHYNLAARLFKPQTIQFHVWDLNHHQRTAQIKLENLEDEELTHVFFSADGQHLVVVSEWNFLPLTMVTDRSLLAHPHKGRVRIWEVVTGRQIAVLNQDYPVSLISLSSNNQYLTTTPNLDTLLNEQSHQSIKEIAAQVWDVNSNREIARLLKTGDQTQGVFFSSDNRYQATTDSQNVQLLDLSSGEVQQFTHVRASTLLGGVGHYKAVVLSEENQYLAATNLGETASVWEVSSGREIMRATHDGLISNVAFSPDEQYLFTASQDKTVRVWEVSSGHQVARILHNDAVASLAFSADFRYLATTGGGTARVALWKPEDLVAEVCQRLTRNLTLQEWSNYFSGEPYRQTCPNLPAPENSQ